MKKRITRIVHKLKRKIPKPKHSFPKSYVVLSLGALIFVPLFITFLRFAPHNRAAGGPGISPHTGYSPKLNKVPSTGRPLIQDTIRKPSTTLFNGRLPLRLVGTFKHDSRFIAYIEDLRYFKTSEYKIGDKVLNATVIKITAGKAVLLRNGHKFTLTLRDSYRWSNPNNWIELVAYDSFIVNKNHLGRRVYDVNNILREIVSVPYIKNGKIQGFIINLLKEGGLVHQAGIEEGDIIKSINGYSLDSVRKPLEIYQYLSNLVRIEREPLVTIKVQRQEEYRTFTYRILES